VGAPPAPGRLVGVPMGAPGLAGGPVGPTGGRRCLGAGTNGCSAAGRRVVGLSLWCGRRRPGVCARGRAPGGAGPAGECANGRAPGWQAGPVGPVGGGGAWARAPVGALAAGRYVVAMWYEKIIVIICLKHMFSAYMYLKTGF